MYEKRTEGKKIGTLIGLPSVERWVNHAIVTHLFVPFSMLTLFFLYEKIISRSTNI